MKGIEKLLPSAVIVLLFPSLSICGAGHRDISDGPEVLLKHIRLFWVDSNDRAPAEETPEGVAWFGGMEKFYRVAEDPLGGLEFRIDSVIGTRFQSRFGTVNTLNLGRVAALPDFARERVREMVDLRIQEREVYWEAAFELVGLHRDEVDWVDALGPALVKPPRRWVNVLHGTLAGSREEETGDAGPCLRFGLFRVCTNVPKMVRALHKGAYPREKSKVRVTQSLWNAGDSCGVVVAGKLLEYSMLTFRVRTNGKGPNPAGVRYLPPFNLVAAGGWGRPDSDDAPDTFQENRWYPRARTHYPGRHRYRGWGRPTPFTLAAPHTVRPFPIPIHRILRKDSSSSSR